MKRMLLGLLAGTLLAFVIFSLFNTFRFSSTFDEAEVDFLTEDNLLLPEVAALAERLGQAIRIKTVSYQQAEKVDALQFDSLGRWIEAQYPTVHQQLQVETVNRWSRLYFWQGSDPRLAPAILLAHTDVVPADSLTLDDWQQTPFSGTITDEFIWGRGTLDDKASVIAILEAAESFLQRGFRPRRSFYFAFGADEEVGGKGAQAIAAILLERGVKAEFVLDEGMAIVDDVIPFGDNPVALIGIAEKGYLTLRLTAKGPAGHSSQPPLKPQTVILAEALVRLSQQQMPASLNSISGMLSALSGEMSIAERFLIGNRWLTEPLLISQLEKSPATNASIRTTTAITMLSGSPKENVLAAEASAVVNFRILPGNSVEDVITHVRQAVNDSPSR